MRSNDCFVHILPRRCSKRTLSDSFFELTSYNAWACFMVFISVLGPPPKAFDLSNTSSFCVALCHSFGLAYAGHGFGPSCHLVGEDPAIWISAFLAIWRPLVGLRPVLGYTHLGCDPCVLCDTQLWHHANVQFPDRDCHNTW